MTTATTPVQGTRAPTAPTGGLGDGLTGTGALVRLALRRDRWRLPAWWLVLTALTYFSGAAVGQLYGDAAAVSAYRGLVEGSPVTVAFSGPPVGLDTVAGVVVYENWFTSVVGVCLMAVLTMSRHTRAEEESGRSELLRATVIGPRATGVAALVVTAGASLVLGGLMGGALLPTALSVEQAALFGASVAALGLVFAAVQLCVAQLFTHSRSATGAGLLLFAVAYALRAAGDVAGNALVWLSPVGWSQATHVPADARWWPLLLSVAASVVAVAVAGRLAARRDFGAGLLPESTGSSHAGRLLSGPFGLGWRVRRTALLGWALGLLAFGLLTGALSTSIQDMVADNPTLADYLETTSGVTVVDSYLSSMGTILALVAGGFAVWSALHPGADEAGGQVELVLSQPVSRVRTVLADVAVTVTATTLVLLAASLGLGVMHGLVSGSVEEAWRGTAASLVYLPAVLLLVGVVLLVDGWRPGLTWVAWLVLTYWAVLGWLGSLLDPPGWVRDLSAFEQTPAYPAEDDGFAVLGVLLAAFLVLVASGVLGYRRRDLG